MLRIGIDLDDCIFDWYAEYLKRFGHPKTDQEITRNVYKTLRKDKQFWENLPIINIPNFIPTLICTKRINSKIYTKNSLKRINLEHVPVYQVYTQSANKADKIRNKVDVFIDDSVRNMIQMNLSGLPCLLMDSPYNQNWGPIGRIYSLNYEEIEDAYILLLETVFNNFYNLL